MRYFILLINCFICCIALNGQSAAREGQDHALFFAVNDYSQHPNFRDLPNPISSSETIARELREMYAFGTEVVPNPDRGAIYEKLRAYQERSFGPDDQHVKKILKAP